jgi:hypothetical protein
MSQKRGTFQTGKVTILSKQATSVSMISTGAKGDRGLGTQGEPRLVTCSRTQQQTTGNLMMNGTGTSCAVGQECAIIDEADFFGIFRTYIECNLYRELTAYHYKGDVIRTRIITG